MFLVDTSVIIDFLKERDNDKVRLFETILNLGLPYGIAVYTYQEVLQGARDSSEYELLYEYLSSQNIYFMSKDVDSYTEAAQLYYNLRRKGVTPRSTIDILIAYIVIKNNLYLLHNDIDFDIIASKTPTLRVLEQLSYSSM